MLIIFLSSLNFNNFYIEKIYNSFTMSTNNISTAIIQPAMISGILLYRRQKLTIPKYVDAENPNTDYKLSGTSFIAIIEKDKPDICKAYKINSARQIYSEHRFNLDNLNAFFLNFQTDTNLFEHINLDYDYFDADKKVYKLNVTAFIVPAFRELNERVGQSYQKIILIRPNKIKYIRKQKTNFVTNQEIIISNPSISDINVKDLITRFFSRDPSIIPFDEFNQFCQTNGLHYSNNFDVSFQTPIQINGRIIGGYRTNGPNGIFDIINEDNSIFLDQITIENANYRFQFQTNRIAPADYPFVLAPNHTDFLVKISNIRFNNKTNGQIIYQSVRSYFVNWQTLEIFLKLVNSRLIYRQGDKTIDDFFTQSADNFTFEQCELNSIQNIYMYYLSISEDYISSKVKSFIESYFRKNFCIDKFFSFEMVALYRFHEVIKRLMIIIITDKYFRIVLNTDNTQRIVKHIPKYISEHVDNNEIQIKGFKSDTNSLEYDSVTFDITGFKVVFDSGNDANTMITTRFLKKLKYINQNDTIPDAIIDQNIIVNDFMNSCRGVGQQCSSTVKSKLCKIFFKFTNPTNNDDNEYNISAFINESNSYDILFGQDAMRKIFENNYCIKYQLKRGSFVYPQQIVTDINTMLNANPVVIANEMSVNIAKKILYGSYTEYLNLELLTNAKITEIINAVRLYYNGLSKRARQYLLFILRYVNPNINELTGVATILPQDVPESQKGLDEFYNTFNIDVANRTNVMDLFS
jgi:hypothetical protein